MTITIQSIPQVQKAQDKKPHVKVKIKLRHIKIGQDITIINKIFFWIFFFFLSLSSSSPLSLLTSGLEFSLLFSWGFGVVSSGFF